MSSSQSEELSKLRDMLRRQRYSPTVIHNYCLYAGQFLAIWRSARLTCATSPRTLSHNSCSTQSGSSNWIAGAHRGPAGHQFRGRAFTLCYGPLCQNGRQRRLP